MRAWLAAKHLRGIRERRFFCEGITALTSELPKPKSQFAEFSYYIATNDPEAGIDIEDRFAAHTGLLHEVGQNRQRASPPTRPDVVRSAQITLKARVHRRASQ